MESVLMVSASPFPPQGLNKLVNQETPPIRYSDRGGLFPCFVILCLSGNVKILISFPAVHNFTLLLLPFLGVSLDQVQ